MSNPDIPEKPKPLDLVTNLLAKVDADIREIPGVNKAKDAFMHPRLEPEGDAVDNVKSTVRQAIDEQPTSET